MSQREPIGAAVKRWLAKVVADEDGNVTIEAVLWFPFFIAVFALIVDVSMILHNHSYVMRVVQDANRAFSTGQFVDENATEAFIAQALNHLSDSVVAQTALVDGIISTYVTIPAHDMDITGTFSSISSINIHVGATHFFEE